MVVSEELTLLSYECSGSARVYAVFKTSDGRRTSRFVKVPTQEEMLENWVTYDAAFLYCLGVAHGRQLQMEKHRKTEIELMGKLVKQRGMSVRELEDRFRLLAEYVA